MPLLGSSENLKSVFIFTHHLYHSVGTFPQTHAVGSSLFQIYASLLSFLWLILGTWFKMASLASLYSCNSNSVSQIHTSPLSAKRLLPTIAAHPDSPFVKAYPEGLHSVTMTSDIKITTRLKWIMPGFMLTGSINYTFCLFSNYFLFVSIFPPIKK